jgi:hypothetical protein
MIKSTRARWKGQVPYVGDMRNAYNILVRNLEGKRAF